MPTFNPNQYIVRQVLLPSGNGLLANAVALTIRNTTSGGGAQVLAFMEIGGQTLFTGTNGASGSIWGVQRVTATPAAGTVLVPFRCHPGATDPATMVEVRHSDTGTITGVTVNQPVAYHLGTASQVGSVAPVALRVSSEENPIFVVGPGDCLVVYAHSVLVAGSRATIGLRWFMAAG
jgi:hypothetical protein